MRATLRQPVSHWPASCRSGSPAQAVDAPKRHEQTGGTGQGPVWIAFAGYEPIYLAGLQALLSRDDRFTVAGSAPDGSAALRLVEARRPDVLVHDIQLPDMGGVELARLVLRRHPAARILVTVDGSAGASSTYALLQVGVLGVVARRSPGPILIGALECVAAGRVVTIGAPVAEPAETMTSRELDVLRLLAQGRRNKEIALALHVTTKTVEFHVSNLFQKLGARSRMEVLLKAEHHGLLATAGAGMPA